MGRENWQIIRDKISGEIASGSFSPGDRLPTEPELCQLFGAGRHSIRRAVAALAVEGKLRVEQGRGTFVESAPLINYHIGRRTRFRQNLQEQGLAPGGDQISAEIVPAPARIARALALEEGAAVHRLLNRGFADDVPISLGLSWCCAARFPDFAERRAAGQAVSDIYAAHGVTDYFRRSTTIFARRAEEEEARLLAQHPLLPVLVVQKTDVDEAGRPIGHSEGVWSAERVQFTFDTDPPGAERPDDSRF
ncbi:GntR family transcriptional regulator [Haematobacter missouriensis]|uniref:Phosphonate metabolism transcriptional regulator PhnF n=1 Tax=Haematobacter missouriensis TaxID=366616 RepID=A0A212AM13_9RHOB|nr:phosphonate metabolism transcriptional regulator PhnF [Haematobacter missouriensis]KFI32938.1 GntR family transcriptional regulator [Haematobacter missouriensis]OWJ73180.1 phosphonate metabolism transcriptional regulator PhnF [Haematobacter missouriensis]OWJ82505.1 phosphonate metabolism transcriptional regulator PhnF [Haematobacter missouriensis]